VRNSLAIVCLDVSFIFYRESDAPVFSFFVITATRLRASCCSELLLSGVPDGGPRARATLRRRAMTGCVMVFQRRILPSCAEIHALFTIGVWLY